MPTYRITGPDGSTYNVTGDGTAEEALAQVQSQAAPKASALPRATAKLPFGDTDTMAAETQASNLGAHSEATFPEAVSTAGSNLKRAFEGGSDRLGAAFTEFGMKHVPGMASDPTVRTNAEAVNKAADEYDANPVKGITGVVGEMLPEVMLTGGPVAKAGGAIGTALTKTLGKYAPAVGDIAANAGYSGAKSALQGNDAQKVLGDTLWGGGGAAGGRLVSKGLRAAGNSLTEPMSAAAKLLKDAGISVTPAQAYPGGITAIMENMAKLIPGYGAQVEKAQARTGDDYVAHITQQALDHIGAKVQGTGRAAISAAKQSVDSAYNDVVDRTFLHPQDAVGALRYAAGDISRMPLLTAEQQRMAQGFIRETLGPEIQKAMAGGPNALISGRVAKNLDAMLGEQARAYADDATTRQLSQAFYAMQRRLRVALDATDPTDKAKLFKANSAFKELLPIEDAVEKSLRQGGQPSTVGLREATKRAGGKPDALSDAAVDVHPTRDWASARRLAGAATVGAGFAGGAPGVAGAMAGIAGASALGHVLGSRTAVKGYLAAMGAPKTIRDAIGKLPYAQQMAALSRYAPATQAGRIAGERMGDEE